VAALCRSGFSHLRQLRSVLRSLIDEAARTLVQAFISSRLNYCNSLLYGVSQSLIRKVQSVQNAIARLLTGARPGEYISPILRRLHWLPVQRRVDFKLACFVFSSFLVLVRQGTSVLGRQRTLGLRRSYRRRLRSSTDGSCAVSPTHLATGALLLPGHVFGLWNSLPAHLRDEDILHQNSASSLLCN